MLGLAALALGGELLVRGATRLAASIGLSPLVVGLTIVAWGTSAPELAVSLEAAVGGRPELAVGNVVGSNIANVLLILGVCAAIAPLVVQARIVQREVPIGVAAAALVIALASDGRIGRGDGLVLLAALVAYTAYAVVHSRRESRAVRAEYEQQFGTRGLPAGARALPMQLVLVVAGLGTLVLGARWLVGAAVSVAQALGVSEVVIGLTIVAVGTSLPELAASLVASLRGERDIAIGNAIGSNLYNLLAILGLASLFTPGGLVVAPGLLRFDMPVMLAVAAACLPVFFVGNRLDRWEGALFLGYYAAYLAYLTLDAVDHHATDEFRLAMVAFVMPITAATIGVLVWRAARARAAS